MASKKRVRSIAPITRAPTRPATTTPNTHGLSLAEIACDRIAELSDIFKGYLAIERLIAPDHADELQASVAPSRAELVSLLRSINILMKRQIEKLMEDIAMLQAQMLVDRAAPPPAP